MRSWQEMLVKSWHCVISWLFLTSHSNPQFCIVHNWPKISHDWCSCPVKSPWHSKLNTLYNFKDSSYLELKLWGFHQTAVISHRNLLTSSNKTTLHIPFMAILGWMAKKSVFFVSEVSNWFNLWRMQMFSLVNLISGSQHEQGMMLALFCFVVFRLICLECWGKEILAH